MKSLIVCLLFIELITPRFILAPEKPVYNDNPVADSMPLTLNKTVLNKSFLAFPIVLRSLETGWGFGGGSAVFVKHNKKADTAVRTSDISFLGLYTLKKQLIFVVNSTIYFPHENKILRFQTSYSYYPDHFWGLGNHSLYSAEEGFTQKQFFFNPQILKRVHKKLYLGGSYEFQHTTIVIYKPNGIFDQQNIAGRFGGNSSGIGPLISWDTRNNAYSPGKGLFAEVQYIFFGSVLGSDFKFSLFNLDYRQFFSFSKTSVLALQAIGGLGSGNVPFRKLEELGGSDMMRGYYGGRFTDRCLMAYQAEWRQFLFWRIGIVGFLSAGQVSSTVNRFAINEFHPAGGGGLRFALSKEEKLNLRIDYGIGRHSKAFNLQIREAF